MPGPWDDYYVLASERSAKLINVLLQEWIINFDAMADEFPWPDQFDEKEAEITYRKPQEVIERLLQEPDKEYSFYWLNRDKEALLKSVMLFFTSDGGLIAGFAVINRTADNGEEGCIIEKRKRTLQAFHRMSIAMSAQSGYCTVEEPPPTTIEEFLKAVSNSSPPKIVNGELIEG